MFRGVTLTLALSHDGRGDGLRPLFEVLRVFPGDLEGSLAVLVQDRRIGTDFEEGLRGIDTALVGGAMEGCAPLPVLGVEVSTMPGEQANDCQPDLPRRQAGEECGVPCSEALTRTPLFQAASRHTPWSLRARPSGAGSCRSVRPELTTSGVLVDEFLVDESVSLRAQAE